MKSLLGDLLCRRRSFLLVLPLLLDAEAGQVASTLHLDVAMLVLSVRLTFDLHLGSYTR